MCPGVPEFKGPRLALCPGRRKLLVRPIMKNKAAAKAIMATTPTTIPAIAPAGKPLPDFDAAIGDDVGVELVVMLAALEVVDVDDATAAVEVPSEGKESPGFNMYFAFLARFICVVSEVDAFLFVSLVDSNRL